jgi:hypothetical protein
MSKEGLGGLELKAVMITLFLCQYKVASGIGDRSACDKQ